jgi:hypothetical protein
MVSQALRRGVGEPMHANVIESRNKAASNRNLAASVIVKRCPYCPVRIAGRRA